MEKDWIRGSSLFCLLKCISDELRIALHRGKQDNTAHQQKSACQDKYRGESEVTRKETAEHWTDNVSEETETRVVAEYFSLHGNRCFLPDISHPDRDDAANGDSEQEPD